VGSVAELQASRVVEETRQRASFIFILSFQIIMMHVDPGL